MEEHRKPHIPAWKLWILAITTAMVIGVAQGYRVHQQMWKEIRYTQSLLNQVLRNDVQYHQDMNQALELIAQELQMGGKE